MKSKSSSNILHQSGLTVPSRGMTCCLGSVCQKKNVSDDRRAPPVLRRPGEHGAQGGGTLVQDCATRI